MTSPSDSPPLPKRGHLFNADSARAAGSKGGQALHAKLRAANGSTSHIRSELDRDLERTLKMLRERRDTLDNDELMAVTRLYAQLTGMIKAQAPADSDATEDRLASAYERAGLERPERLRKRT